MSRLQESKSQVNGSSAEKQPAALPSAEAVAKFVATAE
jgi:hypothetical protein